MYTYKGLHIEDIFYVFIYTNMYVYMHSYIYTQDI